MASLVTISQNRNPDNHNVHQPHVLSNTCDIRIAAKRGSDPILIKVDRIPQVMLNVTFDLSLLFVVGKAKKSQTLL